MHRPRQLELCCVCAKPTNDRANFICPKWCVHAPCCKDCQGEASRRFARLVKLLELELRE
jgi:hypothetical protein